MLDPLGINAKMKWYLVDHIGQLSPSREQAQRAEYFFWSWGKVWEGSIAAGEGADVSLAQPEPAWHCAKANFLPFLSLLSG